MNTKEDKCQNKKLKTSNKRDDQWQLGAFAFWNFVCYSYDSGILASIKTLLSKGAVRLIAASASWHKEVEAAESRKRANGKKLAYLPPSALPQKAL